MPIGWKRVCRVTAPAIMDDEFLLDLLTYDCPVTGRKRCAIQAALHLPASPQKQKLV